MDATNIFQLISGQSPLMVLVILLIYQLIREKETQVKRERESGEALRREQTERISAMQEDGRSGRELLRQTIQAITEIKGEMHALRGKVHESLLTLETRTRRGSNE